MSAKSNENPAKKSAGISCAQAGTRGVQGLYSPARVPYHTLGGIMGRLRHWAESGVPPDLSDEGNKKRCKFHDGIVPRRGRLMRTAHRPFWPAVTEKTHQSPHHASPGATSTIRLCMIWRPDHSALGTDATLVRSSGVPLGGDSGQPLVSTPRRACWSGVQDRVLCTPAL